uniref:EF-hand domain-containing protein n=1 Tax=Electrophorus electricus TaxID=8005 RepID=A0A4W4GID9_ELEEL
MDTPDLRRLFSACDGNKSGRIEYEDFTTVCRELNVPAGEIRTLFSKFDVDGDGCINYSDFCSSFHEASETLNLASLGHSCQSHGNAWDEFENTMDGDVAYYLGRLWDPLSELYQQIHALSDMLLLQQYEDLIKALVVESREHRLESDQLETSLRRTEEMASTQLAEMEEDLQQQLNHAEQRVREEEQKKTDSTIATIQIKHKNELADLQSAVEKLTQHQEEAELNSPRGEVIKYRNEIQELTQENEELRCSLLKAQMRVSVLQVELDKLKNAYADEKLQHERESNDLKKMVIEYQSYPDHIEFLQEMNKKLYDSNDGLRSALAKNTSSSKRRLSPRNEIPPRKLKPLRQNDMSVDPSKEKFSLVERWADKYLDSGVSLQTDTDRMSCTNYDSDDSHESVETVHHSYSYVQSEMEMSDLKSDMNMSIAHSKVSSLASSLRRRLSAFPIKHTESDTFDFDESVPMYRLVLAGDAGSGKSSFLLRLSLNEFRGDMQTTLGVDFQMKKMLVDGEKTNLQIWDTAGQERFRSIARSYFRKAHGVLLLYDVTSESSFLNPFTSDSSFFLLETYNALFCETSAKEGTNVVEAVLHLAREVKKHAKARRPSESQIKLSLGSGKKTLSTCCRV